LTAQVSCPCRNVCLHLDRAPISQEMPFWLSENFKLPKGIGKATLVPVPGATKQVPVLCTEKYIEKDGHTWNCLICSNCETFIYAEKATGGVPIYVNMILQQKPEKELQPQRMLSSLYSPVWKIILKDEDNCSSSVIEPPDASDAERYEHFIKLQRQMQDFLAKEEEAMRSRIREYEQKQLEELRELKTRSFRDRKVLWHRVDQELKKPKSDNTIISTSVQTTETPKTVPTIVTEDVEETDSLLDPVAEKKTNTWKNSRIKEKESGSDYLFQFDDEDPFRSTYDNDNLSADDFDDEVDLNAPEIATYDDSYDYSRASQFHMAASLPVSIPANLMARTGKVKSKSPPSRKVERKPFEGTFDLPDQTNADSAILSKSFAIPKSRNRVRGLL